MNPLRTVIAPASPHAEGVFIAPHGHCIECWFVAFVVALELIAAIYGDGVRLAARHLKLEEDVGSLGVLPIAGANPWRFPSKLETWHKNWSASLRAPAFDLANLMMKTISAKLGRFL